MPKLVVLYPRPTDVEAFEAVYAAEHVPLVAEKMPTARLVASKLSALRGEPPYYRMAELHFDTLEALQAAVGSEGGRATARHAISISTGGPVVFMVAEPA